MSIAKAGVSIVDLDHWARVAAPERGDQWVDGRSAKEAAKYWLAAPATLPTPLSEPLTAHGDFDEVVRWTGEPEVRLPFDRRRGEPRNTDLLIIGEDGRGSVLLAVEAKVDESFGETGGEAVTGAMERRIIIRDRGPMSALWT